MNSRTARALLALTLLAPAFAGCLEGPPPEPKGLTLAATHSFFAVGDLYNGTGVEQFSQALLTVADLDPDTDAGRVLATGRRDGKVWRIECKSFAQQAPDKAFQEGGVARHFYEHGDSGNGDASVPKFMADTAAWGMATVLEEGAPHPDEVTLDESWFCHLMVTRHGFRDDATYAIYKDASRTAFYAREPGSGLVVAGDDEAHLQLKAHASDPAKVRAGATIEDQIQANNTGLPNLPGVLPDDKRRYFAASTPYPNSWFRFNLTLASPGGEMQPTPDEAQVEIEVSLVRKGTTAPNLLPAVVKVTPSAPATYRNLTLEDPGEYEFLVETRKSSPANLAYTYRIENWATPPAPLVYNFWFEDVTWGTEASSLEPFHLKPAPPKNTTSPAA